MIDIGFVHFRTLTLDHFDAAWFTLAQQDFTDVRRVIVLDNNSGEDPLKLQMMMNRYDIPVPMRIVSEPHGDVTRTQSWSTNRMMELVTAPWVFFTRSDFLLDPNCLAMFRALAVSKGAPTWRGFVTSWCHQMGCDDQLSNADVLAAHSEPTAPWRTDPLGVRSLIGHVPACLFQSTYQDAGVYLMQQRDWLLAGGLNEKMVAWGYQQQVFQRQLIRIGVDITVIEDYLFHHQHHAAPRDVGVASSEYSQFSGGM